MQDDLNLSAKQVEIIETSLELLWEKGYNDLSLRDIAKKLTIKAPAIYWHFENKAVLVNYMAEFILRKEMGDFSPREENEPWQDWLFEHITSLRKAMLAYPDGALIVAGAHLYPTITLAKLMNDAVSSLQSAGFDIEDAGNIAMTAIHYTFGYVIEEQADSKNSDMIEQKNSSNSTFLKKLIELGGRNDANFASGLMLIIKGGSIDKL